LGKIQWLRFRISRKLQTDLVQELKPFKLRLVTYSALVVIHDNPGLRQFQLADVLNIERPNLVAIVNELEHRNLIVRARAPTDRRAYALRVTAKGEQVFHTATAAVRKHEAKFCKDMSEDQREAVIAAMKHIWTLTKET
jgi:DNA-binding MarR family transcriptional regulator